MSSTGGNSESNVDSDSVYGPSLPPGLGPTNDSGPATSSEAVREEVLGPPLPPGFKQDDEDTYGPALPPGFQQDQQEDSEEEDSFGPPLPPGHQKDEHVSSEEEGEIIGPLPPAASDAGPGRTVEAQIEARAQRMKDKLEGKDADSAPKREGWMLELPDNHKSFGLGPRTFRKNARPENDDRSVWTDTPEQVEQRKREKLLAKLKNKEEKKEEKPVISQKDLQTQQQVEAHNSDQRSKSLMDMHATKRKRKTEEGECTTNERRPFDREIDLQVNRFDDAQRKNLIKKSAKLDTRFSHGKEKGFL